MKKLDKAGKKAKGILDQEGMSEGAKMRQVQSLYRKEMSQNKKEKKYVVSRKFTAEKQKGNVKSGRFQKAVDKRLKKDKRANKRTEKRNGGALDSRGKKIKKSKKRQISRK